MSERDAMEVALIHEIVLRSEEQSFGRTEWCAYAKALAVALDKARLSELPYLDQLLEEIRALEALLARGGGALLARGGGALREGFEKRLEVLRQHYQLALEQAHALLADTTRRADRVASALYERMSAEPAGAQPEPRDAERALVERPPTIGLDQSFAAIREHLDAVQRRVTLLLLGYPAVPAKVLTRGDLRAAVEEARIAAYAAIGKSAPGTFAWAREQHAQGRSCESLSSGGTISAGTLWEAHRFSPNAFDATDWKLNTGGADD